MTQITFLRLRPAEQVNELWATTRRREGTIAIEIDSLDLVNRDAITAARLVPVSVGIGDTDPLAWVVEPGDALSLNKRGIAGWRICVVDTGDRAVVLDAIARTRAAFLRTGRSSVAAAADLASLPGLDVRVSVFVDSVDDALAGSTAS